MAGVIEQEKIKLDKEHTIEKFKRLKVANPNTETFLLKSFLLRTTKDPDVLTEDRETIRVARIACLSG